MPTTESQTNKANTAIKAATGKGFSQRIAPTPASSAPTQLQQGGGGTREALSFDNPMAEFWIPALLGANPGRILLQKQGREYNEKVRQANEFTDIIGAATQSAILKGNVQMIEALKGPLTSMFGKEGYESALNAAMTTPQALEMSAQLEQMGLIEPLMEVPEEIEPTDYLAERGMEEGVIGEEVAGIAAGLREEQIAEATASNVKRDKEIKKIMRRASTTFDKQGRLQSLTIAKEPVKTFETEDFERVKLLPMPVQDWLADQRIYKKAGITVNLIDNAATGMSYYQTVTPKGEIIGKSPEFQTDLSPEEASAQALEDAERLIQLKAEYGEGITTERFKDVETGITWRIIKDPKGKEIGREEIGKEALTTEEQLAKERRAGALPSTAEERAYIEYRGRMKAKGKTPLPTEEWQMLQSNLDQAAAIYLPKYRDDPVKGLVAEALEPGEAERRLGNWLMWVRNAAEGGNYSNAQLVSKTMEVMSGLGYGPEEIQEQVSKVMNSLMLMEDQSATTARP